MSTKHTPGPWVVGETRARGQEVWIDTDSADPRLMYSRWSGLAVAYGCDEQPEEGAEVAFANARLIAAAPDLLDALKGLLPQTFTGNPTQAELTAHWERERELGNGQAPFVLAAYAAIRKATGEQQ